MRRVYEKSDPLSGRVIARVLARPIIGTKAAGVMGEMSFLFIIFMCLLMLVLSSGCAKKKNDISQVSNEAYVSKSDLEGLHSATKVFTAAEADAADYGIVPGFHADLGFVHFVITEKLLIVERVGESTKLPGQSTVVAKYPITKQFDIIREKNDFGEETNKIIEDEKRPWNERQYIRVDWSQNQADATNLQGLTLNTEIKEESGEVVSPLRVEGDAISFEADVSVVQNEKIIETGDADGVLSPSLRARVRTEFRKVHPSDYRPFEMSNVQFKRFGYFRTYDSVLDPDRGLTQSGLKKYANRFNICERNSATRSLSCSSNQVVYHVNEGFPDEYLEGARSVVKEWNRVLKIALDRKDDVVVLDESFKPNIGDTRYNIIAGIEETVPSSLLGVSQTVVNPGTGETLAARASVYLGTVRAEGGIAAETMDMVLKEISDGTDGKNKKGGIINSQALLMQTGVQKLQHLDAKQLVKLDKLIKKGLKLQGMKPGIEGLGQFKNLRAPVNLKDTTLISRNPLNFPLQKISDGVPSFEEKRASFLTKYNKHEVQDIAWSEVRASEGASDKKTHDIKLSDLVNVGKTERNEKLRALRYADRGIEGTELVDAAVKQFIILFILENQGKDLSQIREDLKLAVRQMVFQSTLLHEMGHNFGLRHNFAGSSDSKNYTDQYFSLEKQIQELLKSQDPDKDEKVASLRLMQQSFDYSSIMDYAGGWHEAQGGLGPYDLAAIRFAYNSSIDPQSDAITGVEHGYKFCTDHQIGEDLLCRQFDKGATVAVATLNAINDYQERYLFRAFRRDRLNFGNPVSYMWRMANVMLPIRQTVDEFIYKLITSPRSSMAGGCGVSFIDESIAAGEMANICDEKVLQKYVQAGVDPSDWSSLFMFLLNEDGSMFLKDPTTYIPGGFADLALSNKFASDFFTDVLGAPEPGLYLIQSQGFMGQLVQIPRTSQSDEESLGNYFLSQGATPDQVQSLVKQNAGMLTQLKAGPDAKYLLSNAIEDGSFKYINNIGYIYDKIAAMIIMGARGLPVSKYQEISLNMNMYFAPQSQTVTQGLYASMMTNNPSMSARLVQAMDGNAYPAIVPAALNIDTQELSMIYGVSDFVSPQAKEFLEKVRVCTDERGCQEYDDNKPVSMRTVSGGDVYRASQTPQKDSVSYSLISKGAELTQVRDQAIDDIQHKSERLLDIKKLVAGESPEKSPAARRKSALTALAVKSEALAKDLLPFYGEGTAAKPSLWTRIMTHGDAAEKLDPVTAQRDVLDFQAAIDATVELITKHIKAPADRTAVINILKPVVADMDAVSSLTFRVVAAPILKENAVQQVGPIQKDVDLLHTIVQIFGI